MQQFQNAHEIENAQLPMSLGSLIEHVLAIELSVSKTATLHPDQGQIILLEDADSEQDLKERFGQPFGNLPFESVRYIPSADAYLCCLLRDNECMLNIVLPCNIRIATSLRANLNQQQC